MAVRMSQFLITILIVGAVFIGIYSFMADLASEQHYNVSGIDDSYIERYNKISNITLISVETRESLVNVSKNEDKSFFTGIIDAFSITKDLIIGGGKIVTGSIGLSKEITTQFTKDIGITASQKSGADYITNLLLAIITIILISILMYLLIQRYW